MRERERFDDHNLMITMWRIFLNQREREREREGFGDCDSESMSTQLSYSLSFSKRLLPTL